MVQILQISSQDEIKKVMREIRVDPYGTGIMLPKALNYLIRIDSISSIAANILKQEMLSLGADVAISRDAITGKVKKTDCLLMGNSSQLSRLNQKLKKQPFGLNELGLELSCALDVYGKDTYRIRVGDRSLTLSEKRTYIMGIMNLTPDSFSGDGLLDERCSISGDHKIIDYAHNLVKDGADIIDIGGESTRPGAKPVSVKEELKRVIPAIKLLSKKIKAAISIDTYKPEVAKQALDNGTLIVNSVAGLRNPEMAKIVSRYKAAVVIMHMKGMPCTMQRNPVYESLMAEIIAYLDAAVKYAVSFGIDREKIIIDPGIGFGKTFEHNLEIIRKLKELKVMGLPILVGPSRKSFIGQILNVPAKERIFGTLSCCVLAAANGASIVRVHDVKPVSQALKIVNSISKVKA